MIVKEYLNGRKEVREEEFTAREHCGHLGWRILDTFPKHERPSDFLKECPRIWDKIRNRVEFLYPNVHVLYVVMAPEGCGWRFWRDPRGMSGTS